jgi:membrane-associated protease RseP (regulator of RpoE activity)
LESETMPFPRHPGFRLIAAMVLAGLGIPSAMGDAAPPEVIRGLMDQEFRVRQEAQESLLGWAREEPATRARQLLEQARTAEDPEVRIRCHDVLRSLAMDVYHQNGEGYIGIQMDMFRAQLPGENQVPRNVVLITRVMGDSPASEAGLQAGDMITGVNGRTFQEGEDLAAFQQMIRELKPGKPATLGILRGNKDLLEIVVKLGRRPPQLDQAFFGQRVEDLHQLARREQDEFFRNWLAELDK